MAVLFPTPPKWNLVALIRASGSAGVEGQSFRGDVLPDTGAAMDGYSMVSYQITAVALSGGIPALPGEISPYTSGVTFDIDADLTLGSNAALIQSLLQAAWQGYLTPNTGYSVGSSVAITTFGYTGGGSHFDLLLTVTSPLAGTPIPAVQATMTGSIPGTYGTLWAGNWNASVSSSGGGGTSDMYLNLEYTPDPYFNPTFGDVGGWALRLTNRNHAVADLEFRLWNVENGAINQTNEGRLAATGPWPIESYGPNHLSNINTTLWWRWRELGGSWSAVQSAISVFPTPDTRVDA